MTNERFIPSIDAKALYEKLKTVGVSEIVSYDELSKAIGRDVQNGARHVLRSALRMAQRQDQRVFVTIPIVGLQRLGDEEIARSGRKFLTKISRCAKRGAAQVTCVDYSALSNEGKTEHNTFLSLSGAIGHFASPKETKKLAAKIEEAHAALPIAKMLEATAEMFKK